MSEPTENQPQPPAAPPDAKAEEKKLEEKPPLERVKWVGIKRKDKDGELVDIEREPPTEVEIFPLEIKLPDAATQRAGFEHEHAREIAQNVRGYKIGVPKGER